MSIIPEKKEEDVSPSMVEIDMLRRQQRSKNVSGFNSKAVPDLATMTRTEKIKFQQRELMLNLQKIHEIQEISKSP